MTRAAIHLAPNPAPARRAFSLVEMALSMVIITVICAATLSVTNIMTRSASASADTAPAGQTMATRDVLDQITRELKAATSVSEQTATAITFTVPDRTGDGIPETIRYACTGSAQPLTRQYNSGTVATLIPSMQSFSLAYLNNTVTVPMPVVAIESSEQLLMSYTTTPNSSTALNTSTWECEYFNPSSTFDAKTVSWKITRVQVMLKKKTSGSTGTVTADIFAADAAQKPTGSSLGSGSVNISSYSTSANTWADFTLATPVADLSPTAGMTLVIKSSTSSTNASVASVINILFLLQPAGQSECTTSNSGSTWSTPDGSTSLNYRIYGTITSTP